MIPVESLVPFLVASFLLSIAPGPDNLFVLTQSALYGKRSGILITLGLCTGLILHTAAVALGVAALVQNSALAFTFLKIAGALYLLYLAWQVFRASAEGLQEERLPRLTDTALYRRGIIMNISNPKVSVFFLAFLPQFASVDNGSLVLQLFLLGGIFIGVALIVFSAIAGLAGTLGEWLKRSPKAQLYLNRTAALILALLAVKLAAPL